jgi:ATP/maltotriose-dependent transcriptional regulator MalT
MLANSLAALAENSYLLGEFDQSLAQGAEALGISQAIDNLWGQSYSQMLAGNVYWERGNPAQAIQTMNECILLAEQAGFTVPQFLTRADLGLIYASLGAVEHGLELVRKGHELAKRSVVFSEWALAYLARVLIQKGSLREAGEILEEASSRFPRGHLGNVFPIVAFSLLIPQIELAISRRDVARAASLADTLIEFLEKGKMRAFLPEALYLSGRAALAQGEAEQARLRLGEARAAAEALGSRRMQWQILAALSDIESGRGNQAEAEAFRKQTSVIVEYIADHTPKDLKESFLNLPRVRALRQADPE